MITCKKKLDTSITFTPFGLCHLLQAGAIRVAKIKYNNKKKQSLSIKSRCTDACAAM